MDRVSAALLLTLAAAGTGCDAMTAPTEASRLSAARALWAAAASPGYRYEILTVCECLQAGRWIDVTVTGDLVTGGRFVDTGTPVDTAALTALPTVPALFDRIQHALNERAVLLDVEYSPQDGHPTLISVDISRTIADDEYTLRSRNLARLADAARASPAR